MPHKVHLGFIPHKNLHSHKEFLFNKFNLILALRKLKYLTNNNLIFQNFPPNFLNFPQILHYLINILLQVNLIIPLKFS